MESHHPVTNRSVRIPPIVWFLAVGVLVALAAIFIFNVAVGTVVYYGLIALMASSCLFMHGSHGAHGDHSTHQPGAKSNPAEADNDKNEHAGHSSGCH